MRRFPPERIVCLTEETVETLYLLGAEDRIVGVSGYAVRPPRVRKEKPRVSAFTSADIPKILALAPDLVLAFSDLQAGIVADLARAGVAVQLFNQRDVAGCLAMVRTLGALVGLPERAEALAAGFEARLAEAAAAVRDRPTLRVYFEEWDAPMISGIGWVSDLIGLAGGRGRVPGLEPAAGRAGPDRHARTGDRSRARRDPRLVVRQAGQCRPHPVPTRLGGDPGRARRAHPRDQVAADPAARPAALTDGFDAIRACLG